MTDYRRWFFRTINVIFIVVLSFTIAFYPSYFSIPDYLTYMLFALVLLESDNWWATPTFADEEIIEGEDKLIPKEQPFKSKHRIIPGFTYNETTNCYEAKMVEKDKIVNDSFEKTSS